MVRLLFVECGNAIPERRDESRRNGGEPPDRAACRVGALRIGPADITDFPMQAPIAKHGEPPVHARSRRPPQYCRRSLWYRASELCREPREECQPGIFFDRHVHQDARRVEARHDFTRIRHSEKGIERSDDIGSGSSIQICYGTTGKFGASPPSGCLEFDPVRVPPCKTGIANEVAVSTSEINETPGRGPVLAQKIQQMSIST